MIESDIETVKSIIQPVLGRKAWDVSLGHGSFLTFEFGDPMPPSKQTKRTHGEWHLWIYCCAWRLEQGDTVIACCEDDREEIAKAIRCLEDKTLEAISFQQPAWDTVFLFEQQIRLRTFCIYTEEYEHWRLYTPGNTVLSMGPGANWEYASSNSTEEERLFQNGQEVP